MLGSSSKGQWGQVLNSRRRRLWLIIRKILLRSRRKMRGRWCLAFKKRSKSLKCLGRVFLKQALGTLVWWANSYSTATSTPTTDSNLTPWNIPPRSPESKPPDPKLTKSIYSANTKPLPTPSPASRTAQSKTSSISNGNKNCPRSNPTWSTKPSSPSWIEPSAINSKSRIWCRRPWWDKFIRPGSRRPKSKDRFSQTRMKTISSSGIRKLSRLRSGRARGRWVWFGSKRIALLRCWRGGILLIRIWKKPRVCCWKKLIGLLNSANKF